MKADQLKSSNENLKAVLDYFIGNMKLKGKPIVVNRIEDL
jgi:hypothetical protein